MKELKEVGMNENYLQKVVEGSDEGVYFEGVQTGGYLLVPVLALSI
jgi:hypothetical protein